MNINTDTYKVARLARDHRFDGVFYTGVLTTGIFCRPICPAPAPKEQNVKYFKSAAEAASFGLRPCKRCRPELVSDMRNWHISEQLVQSAMQMINAGFLDEQTVEQLAQKLGITSRHLTRLFNQQLGASPIQINLSRKLLLARRLLLETALPVTDIALSTGFASVRRFNDAFKKFYQYSPSEVRAKSTIKQQKNTQSLTLTLCYKPPFDWLNLFRFYQQRQIAGVEQVTDTSYQRNIQFDDSVGTICVTANSEKHQLLLELCNIEPKYITKVIANVRRQFDLDTDLKIIQDNFNTCPLLSSVINKNSGLRLPGSYDVFETAIRAIIGQQISVAACTTIMARVAERAMHHFKFALPVFPTAKQMLEISLDNIGLTQARIDTIKRLALAVANKQINLAPYQNSEQVIDSLLALKGIGPWTANYIAFRGMALPDNFPAADLGLRKALKSQFTEQQMAKDGLPKVALVEKYALRWQPYRSYAAILLWNSLLLDEKDR
jgi:AraC family transcriptional regulator, regulatory protein of adaptative response / DNA-3-methyladenine glycosylase II